MASSSLDSILDPNLLCGHLLPQLGPQPIQLGSSACLSTVCLLLKLKGESFSQTRIDLRMPQVGAALVLVLLCSLPVTSGLFAAEHIVDLMLAVTQAAKQEQEPALRRRRRRRTSQTRSTWRT